MLFGAVAVRVRVAVPPGHDSCHLSYHIDRCVVAAVVADDDGTLFGAQPARVYYYGLLLNLNESCSAVYLHHHSH